MSCQYSAEDRHPESDASFEAFRKANPVPDMVTSGSILWERRASDCAIRPAPLTLVGLMKTGRFPARRPA